MGYYMDLMDYSIKIEAASFAQALEAVKKAFPKYEELQSITDFPDAMSEFYYDPEFDGDGNICGFEFDGEKLHDDYEFWCAAAPFVEEGSYIEMMGEDYEHWRWIFKNGQCYAISPTITWEDETA